MQFTILIPMIENIDYLKIKADKWDQWNSKLQMCVRRNKENNTWRKIKNGNAIDWTQYRITWIILGGAELHFQIVGNNIFTYTIFPK